MLTLTPGEALLILIDQCKADQKRLTRLHRLYLSGIQTPADAKDFDGLMQDPALVGVTITKDMQAINRDPVRRYFETHLSYHTAKRPFKSLQANKAAEGYRVLADLLLETAPLCSYLQTMDVVNGDYAGHEYSDLIAAMAGGLFHPQSSNDQRMTLAIIRMMYLTMVLISSHYIRADTLNIYKTGKNYYAPDQRGREDIPAKDYVLSSNRGILKSYMYTPEDDIAHASLREVGRIPDSSKLIPAAAWPQYNFSFLVHPFVTSISGSMLCQLRMLFYLYENNELWFKTQPQFVELLRFMISAMAYYSGGHTLHEFIAPLQMTETKAMFLVTGVFNDLDQRQFTLDYLFYESNKPAFEQAMADTLVYHREHLKRARVCDAIRQVDLSLFGKSRQRFEEKSAEDEPKPEETRGFFMKLFGRK